MTNTVATYLLPFLASFLFSLILTPVVKRFSQRLKIIDKPGGIRKIHSKPTPLLGGMAIFLSFSVCLLFLGVFGFLSDGIVGRSSIIGLVLGGAILMIGGFLDDKFDLKPVISFLFPVTATLTVVALGVSVEYITNPFVAGTGPFGRALFYFDWINLGVVSFGGLFSFLWILGMTYTTKLLDGLDGLATGVGLIGSLILFIVSLFWDVPMSATSLICLSLAGALAGFLPYNFFPAKIFLGEGGSTFIGFSLGVLSIISGAKLATALLIMGLPILDVAWSILRRVFSKSHFYQADQKHLHHLFLQSNISHKTTVLILYFITFIFGTSSIFLQSRHKVLALGVVAVFTAGLLIFLYTKSKKTYENS